MGTKLLHRFWEVRFEVEDVYAFSFQNLRIAFNITKDCESNPNKMQLTIYNLSRTAMSELETSKTTKVYLSLGYGEQENTEVLFIGNVDKVTFERNGSSIITTIEASDGGKALREAKINKTFGKKSNLSDVIGTITDELKDFGFSISKDIKNKVATLIATKDVKKVEQNGFTFMDSAKKALNRVTKRLGLTWYVEDNEVKIVDFDGDFTEYVVLTKETGLLGIPIKRDKGIEFYSLIVPGIIHIGDGVKIKGTNVDGLYRVRQLNFVGGSHEQQWNIRGIAK